MSPPNDSIVLFMKGTRLCICFNWTMSGIYQPLKISISCAAGHRPDSINAFVFPFPTEFQELKFKLTLETPADVSPVGVVPFHKGYFPLKSFKATAQPFLLFLASTWHTTPFDPSGKTITSPTLYEFCAINVAPNNTRATKDKNRFIRSIVLILTFPIIADI